MPQQGQQYPAPGYPQQQQMPQAPLPATMPQTYQADDATANAALAQSGSSGDGRPKAKFLRVPGPAGQIKWDGSVPIGYTGQLRIRLLPPWGPGITTPWEDQRSFFFKSYKNPKGTSLIVNGSGSLFEQALQLALQSSDQRLQMIANDIGRLRIGHLYNVVDVGNPQTHYYTPDGLMRPFILSACPNLQKLIALIIQTKGGVNAFINPQGGRDILIQKKKTGPEERNVEWGATDYDPTPLPQQFWPLLQNLWDLKQQNKLPDQNFVIQCIQDLGLPMPTMGNQVQVPQGYNPAPQAPYPNPYAGQQQLPASMPPQVPNNWVPPPPPAPAMNPPPMNAPMPQQRQQPDMQYPQVPQQNFQIPPAPVPPQVQQQQFQVPPAPVFPQVQQQQFQVPPAPMPPAPQSLPPSMVPPPVYSQPGPSGYAPNPGGNVPIQQPAQQPQQGQSGTGNFPF